MNIKLKKTSILMIMLASFNATADEDMLEQFSILDSEYTAASYLNNKPVERESLLYSKYDRKEKLELLSSLHSLNSIEHKFQYSDLEFEIVQVFSSLYPEYDDYWDFSYKNYLQKDSAIDLEAVNYFTKPNYINKDALKYGFAPVGQDGLEMVVCKLTEKDSSVRLEFNSTDALAFSLALNQNSDKSMHCLGDEELQSYWKERLTQLVLSNEDYSTRYKYDRSR